MRTVALYINDERVDMYGNEQVNVTSSIQNISDIGKTFTDYSQTFSLPASVENNRIFKHYYANDLQDQFSTKIRHAARLEINTATFRLGKIQLEGVELKNGSPSNYKVTFYGDLVSLKDLFGEDKLSDLDYSDEDHNYDSTTILNLARFYDENTNVVFPLVATDRVWQDGGGGADDITTQAGYINFKELRPAVRVKYIFEKIEEKYGVSFSGSFINNKRFTELFTWFKAQDEVQAFGALYRLRPLTGTTTVTQQNHLAPVNPFPNVAINGHTGIVNFSHKSEDVIYDGITHLQTPPAAAELYKQTITIFIESTTATVGYELYVYRNSTLETVVPITTGNGFYTNQTLGIPDNNDVGRQDFYNFKIRANGAAQFQITTKYRIYHDGLLGYDRNYEVTNVHGFGVDYSVDLNSNAPDISISDYFKGVLQMFNLTCFPFGDNRFYLQPLIEWYNSGLDKDITEYVDLDTIKIDRPKLYKSIDFTYQKTDAVLNKGYRDSINKDYGSLRTYFDYDGGKFAINLPFTNLLHTASTTDNTQFALSVKDDPNFEQITPKPVMLYSQGYSNDVSFYYGSEAGQANITEWAMFGSEIEYNNEKHSINWGSERSVLDNTTITNSLYEVYYRAYIANLYQDKSRLVKVKAVLPVPVLEELQLNDSLLIKDQRYKINSYKTNLNTGVVSLELITDFITSTSQSTANSPDVETGADYREYTETIEPIGPVTKGGYVILSAVTQTFTSTDVTLPALIETATDVVFTIQANTTGLDRTDEYSICYYDAGGNLLYCNPYFITQTATNGFLLAEEGGYILTEELDRIII